MKRVGMKLVFLSFCLVLAVALALPACAPVPTPTPTPIPTPAPEAKPLTIGFLLPYTGPASPWTAPHTEAAAKLRLDEANWKVAGRPIKMVAEDDAGNPETGIEKAKKLVDTDKAEVLIGALFGPVTIAVSKYASQAGVVFSAYIQESMECLRASPNYSFLPFGTLAGGNYALGVYAAQEKGYKTATVIYNDFVAGEEFIGGFEQGFKDNGGTVIQRQPVPLGTVDFAPYLTNLQQADVLAFWFAGTMNIFLGQYYDFGVKIPVLVPSVWCLETEPMQAMGDTPLGLVGSGHANEWVTDIPQNPPFVKAMHDRGFLPIQYAYAMYTAVDTCLAALETTGGDTSPQKLHDAWRNVKKDTPAGPIAFDELGCGIMQNYLYQWSKGDQGYYWKPIKEYPQAPMKVKGVDY